MPAFGGEDAESYYDEGLTASMKGDVPTAIKHFEKAIDLDNGMLSAYHQLAKCYLRLGQTARGVELLRRVVQHNARMAAAVVDLGYGLLELGYLEEARKQFMEALKVQPDNPRANLGLARVCFDEGNWDGAVVLAQEARAKSGDHFAALFLLGRAAKLAGTGDMADKVLEEADAVLEKSVELNPDQPEGYYLRGELAFALEQFGTALEHYLGADKRADDARFYTAFGEQFRRADVLAKQGLCMQRLGKLDKAREIGESVLSLDPDHKIGQALKEL